MINNGWMKNKQHGGTFKQYSYDEMGVFGRVACWVETDQKAMKTKNWGSTYYVEINRLFDDIGPTKKWVTIKKRKCLNEPYPNCSYKKAKESINIFMLLLSNDILDKIIITHEISDHNYIRNNPCIIIDYIQRQFANNKDKQAKIIDAIKWICKFMKHNDPLLRVFHDPEIWDNACEYYQRWKEELIPYFKQKRLENEQNQ